MHAALLVVLPFAAYLASRVAGVAAVTTDDRVVAATRLRRATRGLQVASALTGVAVVTDSPLDDAIGAAIPGPEPVGVLGALAATVFAGGFLPALAVHLGTRPAWETVTGNVVEYAATVRRFAAVVAFLLAPAFVVVAAWLAAPPGVPGIWAVLGAVIVVVALLPRVVARFGPVRPPSTAEATLIPACADGLRVRVVETDRHPVANAVAAGILPGYRYVFVTDALLHTLDAEATAAVLAHEAGHHDRHHVVGRLLASGVALAPLFLSATGVVDAFVPAVVISGVLLLAIGPLVRWTEFDADAYAAAEVGAPAMERALATLADRGLLPVERPRVVALVSLHPAVGRRVARLRGPHGF